MDRREFLVTGGGAAVVAAATGTAAAADPQNPPGDGALASSATVLRMAMPWADAPNGAADSARRLARRFEVMTGGRYRIELLAGQVAAPADADLLHGSAHDFADRHRAFSYFAGLPGSAGLTAQDLAHWVSVGGGQMLWDDLAAEAGWKPFLAGHSGEAPPLWSPTPITRLADLAGRRIAAAGLAQDVVRGLGAEAVDVLPHQVAEALKDGRADAAEAGGLLTSLMSGAPKVARYATGSGFNGRGTALSLNVRLSVWDSLPDADRAVLAAAAAEEFQLALAEARAHEAIARRTLESSFGVTFAAWPTEIAEALDRVAEATIAHVAGQDATAARIDQSYMAFRAALSGRAAPHRTASAPLV